jgi:ribosome-binding factor A
VATPLRIKRLEQQVHGLIANVLARGVSDPRLGLVTITRVSMSKDLETCDVYWSTLDEGAARKRTEGALDSARGFIQREVAGALDLRTAPRLKFRFDKAFEASTRVQKLIGDAREKDEARRKDRPPGEEPA